MVGPSKRREHLCRPAHRTQPPQPQPAPCSLTVAPRGRYSLNTHARQTTSLQQVAAWGCNKTDIVGHRAGFGVGAIAVKGEIVGHVPCREGIVNQVKAQRGVVLEVLGLAGVFFPTTVATRSDNGCPRDGRSWK